MMKKLFTFLLLISAVLWSNPMSAEPGDPETVLSTNDFDIIKISPNEYKVVSKSQNGANINDMNGYTFTPNHEKNAFLDCTGKISIEGNFQNIGGLNNLKFSNVNLKNYTGSSFKIKDRSWSNLTTLVLSDTWTDLESLTDLDSGVTDLTIGLNVTNIPADKVKLKTCLKTLRFADAANAPGLTIASKAFKEFTALETIEWPTRLTAIGEAVVGDASTSEGSFEGCTALKSIDLSTCTKLSIIGKDAFHNCTGVESVTLPGSVEIIGNEAFDGCNNQKFTTINLSGLTKLTTIGFEAFERCTYLKYVTLPAGTALKHFAHEVFKETAVESLDMSMCEGIEEFDFCGRNGSYRVFRGYSNLKYVSLPPNLKYLGNTFGFDSGVSFTDGKYPLEVVFNGAIANPTAATWESDGLVIGKDAFKANPALQKVTFAANSNLKEIGESAFENCTNLQTVTLNGKAKYNATCVLINPVEIKTKAFQNCANLTSVKLGDNIQYIRTLAFTQCHLTDISIPASVELIEIAAFENNPYMTKVIFEEISNDCAPCKGKETRIQGGDTSGGQGHGAFNNCKAITDVYINTTSNLSCQNNAFDQHITWGAGDPDKPFATLHFPEENIENYVNITHYLTDAIVANNGLFHDWLMEHYFQAGDPKMNGWYEFVNSGPSKGPSDPGTNDIILRTFSDWSNAYLVPNGLRAYIVNGVAYNTKDKVYELTVKRINVIPAKTGVILYGHPNSRTQGGQPTLAMTPVRFAPVNQTVTILGQQVTVTVEQGKALCRANWKENGGTQEEADKNYLEPTSTNANPTDEEKAAHPDWADIEDGKFKGGIYVKPYENEITTQHPYDPYNYYSDQTVTFRNFAMGRYGNTRYLGKNADTKLQDKEDNYEAFFRMIKGYYAGGKAYLRLADSEYSEKTGAEILVKKDVGVNDYDYHWEQNIGKACGNVASGAMYDAREVEDLNPKGWWNYDNGFDWDIYDATSNKYGAPRMNWGKRPQRFYQNPSAAPIYLGEFGEEADGIIKIIIPADTYTNGDYYTLQGVKVTNPTKGIYIHNGKKVIIK